MDRDKSFETKSNKGGSCKAEVSICPKKRGRVKIEPYPFKVYWYSVLFIFILASSQGG